VKELCIGYECVICGERVAVFRLQQGGETTILPPVKQVSCKQGHPSTISVSLFAFLDHWTEEVETGKLIAD